MTYFLEDVAKYLFEYKKGNFLDLIVVFPNRRARLFFNKYLSSLTNTPLWTPKYYTIADFVQQLSHKNIADPITLLFKLFEVYKNITGSGESFDSFYYYCETILSDFDDIDKYHVDADKLFKNLANLKELEATTEYLSESQIETIKKFWETFTTKNLSNEQEDFIKIWESLRKIYHEFNHTIEQEGIAYEGKAYREAIQNLRDGKLPDLKEKTIAFVGFNALNYSEEIIFEFCQKNTDSLFFWDYDNSYIHSDMHEAGYFMKKYLKHFPQPQGFKTETTLKEAAASITIVNAPSEIAMARGTKFFLESLPNKETSGLENTALVLGNESLLMPVINSIPEGFDKINISLGYPVVETPIYSFINDLSNLHINARYQKDKEILEVYHKDYFKIVNHTYFSNLHAEQNFKNFENNCIERNITYIDPCELNTQNDLYKKVFVRLTDPHHFAAYINGLLEVIAKTLVKERPESKEILWQLENIHGIYKLITRCDDLLKNSDLGLTYNTVMKLIRRIISTFSVPFSGEPLMGLQIMGVLETRTLDFENLIVYSMNEGSFPQSGHVPTMIPYSIREAFELPTVRHQDAIFGYYFYRLLHRAKNVILVYSTKSEGIKKGEPSRYIQQLRFGSKFNIKELSLGYEIKPLPKKNFFAQKDAYALNKLKDYFDSENKFLSASALNTYLNCPLRFYFRYVEKLKENEEIQDEIESDVFGSILHQSMEILYERFVKQVVSKDDINIILKDEGLIEADITQSLIDVYTKNQESSREMELKGKDLLIKKIIKKYIIGLLKYDNKNEGFSLISLESKHVKPYKLNNGETVRVGGIIDRLDMKDGSIRVIDYKTGSVNPRFKDIPSLFDTKFEKRNNPAFQAFLYSLIIQGQYRNHSIVPSLFFVRDIYNDNFDYHVTKSENRKSIPIIDFSDYSEEFEENLKGLLEDIFDPDIDFMPTEYKKRCSYCPYNIICARK